MSSTNISKHSRELLGLRENESRLYMQKCFQVKAVNSCCRSDLFGICIFHNIGKTYLYNFDPLKPHFYIVKLGFTGVYIISLFLLKTDCGYWLEPPRRGGSKSTHNLCFEQKYEKYQFSFV